MRIYSIGPASYKPTEISDPLIELGLVRPGATREERSEAIRVFQQARHLPETGKLDRATRAELRDSLELMRRR